MFNFIYLCVRNSSTIIPPISCSAFMWCKSVPIRKMRNLALLSNSTLHGSDYFEWAAEYIEPFLKKFSVSKVLFVPYALKDHDDYTSKVKDVFNKMGVNLSGIHTSKDPVAAVGACQAIFIGGGNTFRLLKALYDFNLIDAIKNRVLLDGIPYIDSSAGTNVATVNICTTNDMPIVFPPSFDALGLVPFNINPHYIEPEVNSKHMGETRDQRIKQYHEIPGTSPVVGLKEGSLLFVENDSVILEGLTSAKLFMPNAEPKEYPVGSDLSFLLK